MKFVANRAVQLPRIRLHATDSHYTYTMPLEEHSIYKEMSSVENKYRPIYTREIPVDWNSTYKDLIS